MKGEIAFIQPECFISGDTASAIWRIAMGEAERIYHKLLECGWLSQDARKVLPNSTATRIVMKANLREWRYIFALRTSPAAYPEIRAQMTDLLNQAREAIPVVFDSLEAAE